MGAPTTAPETGEGPVIRLAGWNLSVDNPAVRALAGSTALGLPLPAC